MNIDHDPGLQTLFAKARHELVDDGFILRVMTEIDKLRRRATITWVGIGLVLVAVAWLLTPPLTAAVALLTQVLPVSLIDVDNHWVAEIFAPINSIAGVVGISFLLLLALFRKLLR